MRIVLLGNAGAGKTTMARQLIDNQDIAHLSLDAIAWSDGTERRPLADSLRALERFLDAHEQWVIEGCYGDLVEAALPRCTELGLLNPGVDACVAHCCARPWEPDKFTSAHEQQAMLAPLIEWVSAYAARDDEYGYRRHRAIFDGFAGAKREYTAADLA